MGIDTIGISNDESAANALVGTNDGTWPLESIDSVSFLVSPFSTGQYAVEACIEQAGFDAASATYEGFTSQGDILNKLANQSMPMYSGLWAPNTYRLLESETPAQILCTGQDASAIIPGAMIVNEAFATDNPDVVAKVLAGWLRGIEFIKKADNRERVIEYIEEFYGKYDVSISKAAMELEIDTRPLYGLEEQVTIMASDAKTWFTDVATFLEANGQLATGIPEASQ